MDKQVLQEISNRTQEKIEMQRRSRKRLREKGQIGCVKDMTLFNHKKINLSSSIFVEKQKPIVIEKVEPSTPKPWTGVANETAVLERLSEVFEEIKHRSICNKAVKLFKSVSRKYSKPKLLRRELDSLSFTVDDCIDDLHSIPRSPDMIPTITMEELIDAVKETSGESFTWRINRGHWPNERFAKKIKRLHKLMCKVGDNPPGWKVWLRIEGNRKPLLFTLARGGFKSRTFQEACLQRFTTKKGSNFYHYFCF